MRQATAIIGSTTDHGGVIITGSPEVECEGSKVARCGDLHICPIEGHGITPIVTAAPGAFSNGQAMARVGDATFCGAIIQTGCDTVTGNDTIQPCA